MSRREFFKKRKILPDQKFKSTLISKFINLVMINGKKSIAEFIVYSSLNLISKKKNKNHLIILEDILNKVRPSIEIKRKKVGGSTYQIPVEVNINRKDTLAIRWIINFSRKRKEKSMILKLTNEFLDILDNKGSSIKKKEEIYRIAEANKAFAHYRW